MPIKIPTGLPGRKILERERVPLITEDVARRQDIRPLQIALLNLMPDKIRTETQFLRILGATPLQIEMTLLRPATHEAKNTSLDHLLAFYQTWDQVKDRRFDALIVTGAPVGNLAFENVTYWKELTEIFDWATTNVHSSFFVCWGAQAALYHYHSLAKHQLPAKLSGIYAHEILAPFEDLIRGFDDTVQVPVSRHTEVRKADIEERNNLKVLVSSEESGACLVYDGDARHVYMFNHLEYEADVLKLEYDRDMSAGLSPALPANYFPDNDASRKPATSWRAHRNLLFGNWINMIYQTTPYDIEMIKK